MEIPLTQGKVAIIDRSDYDLVSPFKWCAAKSGNRWYAVRTTYIPTKKTIRLHRLLLNSKPNEKCDHINHDGLDNRRSNLRVATNSQNMMNQFKLSGTTSSHFKGVVWHKRDKIWEASIRLNQRGIYLGRFSDEVEAAKAYNMAAIKYFGEYARLNQLGGNEDHD